MEINSPGQVSSLTPETTRPNAPAQAQPAGAQNAAPTGGASQTSPTQAVATLGADGDVANDGPRDEPKDAPAGIDITV